MKFLTFLLKGKLFKNTERPQKFCGNAVKERGNTPQINKVFKNTETPQRFLRKRIKK